MPASFILNTLPTATLLAPNDAAGRLAKMVYTPGSGWTGPRMEVAWTYASGDAAQPQTQYELEIAVSSTPSAAGGTPGATIVSGAVASAATSAIPVPSSAFIEGNYYHVRVRVNDGLEWSNWSGWFACRVRWGLTTHAKNMNAGVLGVTPTGWSVSALSTGEPANTDIVIEYNSSTGGGAPPDPWKADLGLVTKRDWVHYRVWFFGWGTSPASRPTLNDITIQVSGLTLQPDAWLPIPISGEGGTIELGKFAFGGQSLKMIGDGTVQIINQQVRVEPNTDYMLQGRIESIGNSGGAVSLSDTASGAALVSTTAKAADSSFADGPQVIATPWNSGSRVAVWIQTRVTGSSSTACLFDGIGLTKGTVVPPWTPNTLAAVPGQAGLAATLDAGGFQVDAKYGGIARLRGSAGGARDVVELGANGWKFGGGTSPVNLYSPSADLLEVDDDFSVLGGDLNLNTDTRMRRSAAKTLLFDDNAGGALAKIGLGAALLGFGGSAFPGSPATDDLFYRTDRDILYFYDGTRWLTVGVFSVEVPKYATSAASINATLSAASLGGFPSLVNGSDIWEVGYEIRHFCTAGTALSASHSWVGTLVRGGKGDGSEDTITTYSINSGASNVWRDSGLVAIGALTNNGVAHNYWRLNWVKTGTPGDLSWTFNMIYRLVG